MKKDVKISGQDVRNLVISCEFWKLRYVKAMVFLIDEITSDSYNRTEKLKYSEPCRKNLEDPYRLYYC